MYFVYWVFRLTIFSEDSCQFIFVFFDFSLWWSRYQMRNLLILADASFVTLIHISIPRFICHFLKTLEKQMLRSSLTSLSFHLTNVKQLVSSLFQFFVLIGLVREIPSTTAWFVIFDQLVLLVQLHLWKIYGTWFIELIFLMQCHRFMLRRLLIVGIILVSETCAQSCSIVVRLL